MYIPVRYVCVCTITAKNMCVICCARSTIDISTGVCAAVHARGHNIIRALIHHLEKEEAPFLSLSLSQEEREQTFQSL
jgi:hypothetical protein